MLIVVAWCWSIKKLRHLKQSVNIKTCLFDLINPNNPNVVRGLSKQKYIQNILTPKS